MARYILPLLFSMVLLTAPTVAKNAALSLKNGYYIRATKVTYLTKLDTVIAEGDVLIFSENRTLLADRIVFHRASGTIEATGNIWLRTAQGDYTYAQEARFTHRLKEGEAEKIRIIQTDQSRFAADRAEYKGDDIFLDRAAYTPCKVCQNGENTHPTWQLKADSIHYSHEDETVYYRNARLEVLGWPIFATPFLRHPSPAVKRKSGLLAPTLATTSDLGFVYGQPVYYAGRHHDVTLTPIVTTRQGPVMIGEYRHRLRDAQVIMNGSVTHTRRSTARKGTTNLPGRNRWHTWIENRIEPSDHHLFTFQFKRASDLTYLRRYPILTDRFYRAPHTKNLTSIVQLEQFYPRSYAGATILSFQTDDKNTTPLVLPLLKTDYQSDPGRWGQLLFAQGTFRALGRQVDLPGVSPRESQLFSTHLGGKLPYVSAWGDEWSAQLSLRGGLYRLNHYRFTHADAPHTHVQGYAVPQASLTWRYPFIAHYTHVNLMVAPQVMVVSSKHSRRLDLFPNEDSSNVELDYTTLFLANRFPGLDRYDGGTRVIYGLNNRWFFPDGRRVVVFLGQTHRLDHQMVLPSGAGEDRVASDVIMRVKIDPVPWLTIQHQGRLHRKTLRPQVSELSTVMGPQWCRLSTGHIYLAPQPSLGLPRIHQLNWQLSTHLTAAWAVNYGESRNLNVSVRGLLARRATVAYTNDCIQVSVGAYQTRYTDRDIRPDVGVLFNLQFKNLGGFSPTTAPSSTGDVFSTPY